MVWVPTARLVVLMLATYLSGFWVLVTATGDVPTNVVPSKNDTVPVGIWVAEPGILTSAESSTGWPNPAVPPPLNIVVVAIGEFCAYAADALKRKKTTDNDGSTMQENALFQMLLPNLSASFFTIFSQTISS
jgi:hypothetical protein